VLAFMFEGVEGREMWDGELTYLWDYLIVL